MEKAKTALKEAKRVMQAANKAERKAQRTMKEDDEEQGAMKKAKEATKEAQRVMKEAQTSMKEARAAIRKEKPKLFRRSEGRAVSRQNAEQAIAVYKKYAHNPEAMEALERLRARAMSRAALPAMSSSLPGLDIHNSASSTMLGVSTLNSTSAAAALSGSEASGGDKSGEEISDESGEDFDDDFGEDLYSDTAHASATSTMAGLGVGGKDIHTQVYEPFVDEPDSKEYEPFEHEPDHQNNLSMDTVPLALGPRFSLCIEALISIIEDNGTGIKLGILDSAISRLHHRELYLLHAVSQPVMWQRHWKLTQQLESVRGQLAVLQQLKLLIAGLMR